MDEMSKEYRTEPPDPAEFLANYAKTLSPDILAMLAERFERMQPSTAVRVMLVDSYNRSCEDHKKILATLYILYQPQIIERTIKKVREYVSNFNN